MPRCPDNPHPGGIHPKAKGAEDRHGSEAGTPGERPVAQEGGGPHATRIHPRWNQLNPRLPPPEGPWLGLLLPHFPKTQSKMSPQAGPRVPVNEKECTGQGEERSTSGNQEGRRSHAGDPPQDPQLRSGGGGTKVATLPKDGGQGGVTPNPVWVQ